MERLLIVEDEKMIRKGIRAIAERSGICIEEIVEARNGLEAYEYLSTHKVELMFTDIRMPKMDGIQLVQKLKEEEKLPKVIVISGYDDFEYATKLMRCGARDYMLKPIEMDKLTAVLCKMEAELEQEKQQWKEKEELKVYQLENLITQKLSENNEEYKNQMKMKEAVKYIQANFEKDLCMAEVSNHIGISYSWFSTVFKEYAGMNFVNYLKNIRLEEAKKLLSTTDWKVQDISRQVGYENELHFMKTFKSSFGISPTQYRNVRNAVEECRDLNH